MKSCPTCSRTFEDTFTFCLIDGTVLSAPFDTQAASIDPSATMVFSNTPHSATAATEVFADQATSSPTGNNAQPLQIIGQPASPRMAPPPAKPFPWGKAIAWFITAIATFLVFCFLGFAIYWRVSSNNAAKTKNENVNVTTPNVDANANRERPNAPTNSSTNTSGDPSSDDSLAGTTWSVVRTRGDNNQQYNETFEFKAGGKFVEQIPGHALDGNWSISGNELVIDVADTEIFVAKRITATIEDDKMTGTFNYLGHGPDDYFTAQPANP
jgi:hypothetical protein